jgi:hypothetical protein
MTREEIEAFTRAQSQLMCERTHNQRELRESLGKAIFEERRRIDNPQRHIIEEDEENEEEETVPA